MTRFTHHQLSVISNQYSVEINGVQTTDDSLQQPAVRGSEEPSGSRREAVYA